MSSKSKVRKWTFSLQMIKLVRILSFSSLSSIINIYERQLEIFNSIQCLFLNFRSSKYIIFKFSKTIYHNAFFIAHILSFCYVCMTIWIVSFFLKFDMAKINIDLTNQKKKLHFKRVISISFAGESTTEGISECTELCCIRQNCLHYLSKYVCSCRQCLRTCSHFIYSFWWNIYV